MTDEQIGAADAFVRAVGVSEIVIVGHGKAKWVDWVSDGAHRNRERGWI